MIDLARSEDLHDSNLLLVELDLAKHSLVMRLDAYLSETNRNRTGIVIRFWGVRTFSATADLEALGAHSPFGNIAHWSPRTGFNLLSLAAGAISFSADGFDVSKAAE